MRPPFTGGNHADQGFLYSKLCCYATILFTTIGTLSNFNHLSIREFRVRVHCAPLMPAPFYRVFNVASRFSLVQVIRSDTAWGVAVVTSKRARG